MKKEGDMVNIIVYEGNIDDKIAQKDILEKYFSLFLRIKIPSSMPCPCCGKLMCRDKDLYGKRYTQKHPMIIGATVKILGKEPSQNYRQILALCEDCYKEGIKSIITAPHNYIINTEKKPNM